MESYRIKRLPPLLKPDLTTVWHSPLSPTTPLDTMPTAELSLKKDKRKQFIFEPELLLNELEEQDQDQDQDQEHMLDEEGEEEMEKYPRTLIMNDNVTNNNTTTTTNEELKQGYMETISDHESQGEYEYFVSDFMASPDHNYFTVKDNQITVVRRDAHADNNHGNTDMVILFLTK